MIIMKVVTLKYFSRVFFLFAMLLFFFASNILAQKKYILNYVLSGKDTLYKPQQLGLKTSFDGKEFADVYINSIPATLLSKGFPAASVDSVFYDSTSANVDLYLGERFKWVQINTDNIDQKLLETIGWNAKQFNNKAIDFNRLHQQQEKICLLYTSDAADE